MARAPSLLSLCTRQRILSVVLVLLQPLLLVSQTSFVAIAEASKVPDYEFQLTFYDKPVPWQKCPEDWIQYGSKCYKTFFQQVSWQEADKVCKSLGGSLVEVKGFNQNQDLGQIISEGLSQSWTTDHVVSLSTGNLSLHSWIGLKRRVNGDYTWASGRAGHEQQGFWDIGNPPTLSTLSSNSHVNEQCCDINLNSTEYGEFRWSLTGCDNKRIFMCETFACNKYQFRCTNSQQCVGSKSVCDGERDCDDGSDELDCGLGVDCGGSLQGPSGTFHSPRFPDLYPDYATCIWQIWTPVGTKVQLQFEIFSTELRYDKVEVFDGSERQDSARLGIYSGNQVPVVPLASSNVLLVTFTSDFSQQAHGFNVTWFTESFGDHSGACGGKFSADSHVQWFTSPLFPTYPYPDNLVCEWIITTHNSSDIITLQFVEFHVDSPYDWVEVHDGSEEQDLLLGHFSGSQLPQVIVSSGPAIFVRFKTDLSHGERGFNATYETGCSVNITFGYARISSPGYRVNNYPDNIYCVWHIIDNSSRNLTLIFNSDFDTELYMDVVKVYNSSHTSERNLAAELSGNVIPARFHSDEKGFLIIFESDGNVNRPGWAAAISYDCDPLPIKPPLHINTSSVAFGSAVEYQCQEGYILSGPSITVCGLQAWSPSTVPYCQLIECGSPSIPKEGYLVHLSNTTYGGVASYRCNTGYRMQGTNNVVCKDGNWTKLPTCEEIFCPKEPPPSNGTGMAEDNRYGALREYFCNHGYQLIGAKFSHCTANGSWSSPIPRCQITQCPAIVGLSNGYPSKTGPVSIRDTVVMSCDSGYEMIGSSTLLCTPDLIYDKPLPVCKDIDECSSAEGSICRNGVCQNLPGDFRCICQAGYKNPGNDKTICKDNNECQTANGGCSHTCENFQGGYRCTCKPGFQLYNGSLTNYGGLLLSPGRTCISVCKPFSVMEGLVFYTKASLKDGAYLYPAEAFISCPHGSIPDGPALVKCQQEGGWSASVTACRVSYCPQLNNPDHGTVDTNGLTLNSKASYSCKKGYQLMGTKFRYCQLYQDRSTYLQRFQWTDVDPFCQVNCGMPPQIDNGVALYLHTTLGGEAVYSCDCGYYLTGDMVVQCQDNGLWSGNGSTCNVLTCSTPENPTYGILEQTQFMYSVGSVLDIACDRPGYDLSDPWPLKCESPVRKQVASVLPLYQLDVNFSLETGSGMNITLSCGTNYQEKAETLFTQFLSQFEMFCTSPVQRKIVIDSDSYIHISGNRVNVTLWAELSVARREVLYDACSCGEYIAASLKSSFSSMLSSMLESSHDPDCPAVSLLQNTLHTSGLGWRCPEKLELLGEGPQCWMGIPACWEKCEDRIYGTSTISPSPLSTDHETITSFPPSVTMSTTFSVPVTTSFLPSTYDLSLLSWNVTLSSTDVQSNIASSKPAFTAESETSSESTVKDITIKSTTLPSAISSDVFTKTTLSPSLSVTVVPAFFSLRVEDILQGSFRNLSCIDAVHLSINKKVVSMMQDFKSHIGKDYCLNASDVTVDLKSGNISFKGNKAEIRIQFSLRSANSSHQAVESCGERFKDFLLKELPAMFIQVVKEVLKVSCENASYPAADISITESDWTCPTDYILDQELLSCSRSITSTLASTTAATSTPSPTQAQVPVKTIPRMVRTFKGTFVQETQGTGAEKCENEYTGGLLAFLTDLEPAMQNRDASCAAIYVNITANITLARRGNKYDAESQVILMALDGSVDRLAMHRCAAFVTSELLYPLNHLPNVTLPKPYLQNCPAITLNPAQLSSNASSISYFCPDSYIYDVFNFQCIDETLPSYTIHIDLAITDVTDSNSCQQAIQKAAEDVDQMVVGNTQKLILTGVLCSVSSVGARILLQPQNARLSLAVAQTTISIPLVLVSLDGQIAPVQNCRNELYTYLAMALDLPVKNMTTSIQRACSNAVGPNNYTISSEEWTCFEGSLYNSETHTCVKTGIVGKSPTDITGDSDLKVKRRKRDVWSSLLVTALPYWNTTIPSCQDHEAPTFHDCPKMEQRIELGLGGPLPVNISIPEISDNSRGQLFVSFQPDDFHLPYIFHHNMTVNMSVTDSAGNNAVCRMSVGLIDTTPPLVECPSQVHKQHYAGNSSHIPLVLPLDVVSSWDFSGISHKVFSPSLGTLVPVLQELSITVTVFDFFGNSANCSFVYFIEMDVCPLWTLPEPSGGKRVCPDQVDSLAGKGFSCTVSCNHSYGFISPPPTQYTCVNGSNWQPHNYVPDCALRVYPNQDLNLTLNFTYNGTISNECAKQIGNSLLANLEPVFAKICEIIADNITMNITHMGYFDPQNQFSLKMKVQLVLNTKALVDAARWCGKQIGTKLETFPVQASASCGMASLQPPVDFLVQDTCSDGSILVNGSCLECPQGMHQTGSICVECPADSYQDQKGQQTCFSCPPGMHTLTDGAKTSRECMAACEPGYYSSTGLVPCFICPKGWYQSKHRATECDQCTSGYSTYSQAARSHENCKAKCQPGLYSLSGLEPCSACPVGFFATEIGSHFCLECPRNMTTLKTGSSSDTQCLEIDQCKNQPCGYGATCINHFRFFHCICPAGYTGILCDENIDDCASQPCMNGGACEDHIGYYSCHCKAGFQGTICEQQTNECNPNPCEHGQCIDLNLNYACSCYQGYTGARCEMLIDKCLETPCQHGGMCISRIGGYQCDCTGTGYEGHNCERNINDCSASSCQNGATCSDLLGAFSCICASGFVGESCEENVDDCNSSPCENGGLCVDGVDSLTCICKPGYTGQQCEEEIDECLSSPCKNGGACTDLLHDYTCLCATGFTGRNCEENIDDCMNSPCNMTGTDWCEDGVNFYKCHCLAHWTGKLCQELEDPCSIAPCAEGATCNSSGQDFVCTCPADFTGTLCEVRIDNCASRPCLNNGSCVETVHNFMCLCAEGFTGVECETNVNECWSQPCLNGGTCRDLVNGYACSCVPGYVGEQCEENVDECISQPCLHGATCSDHVNDFHCDCPKGFEGKTCERNVNECLYNPCKNGGTCIDLEGQFLCLCPPNYNGSNCQSGPCSLNDTCQNGATCINSQGKATCLCPPAYAGEDCGKEKSGDYDMWFPGSKDSFCNPPPFVFPGGSEFAVCLWVRFASSQTRGTYLTLFSIVENDRNNYTMLDMTGNTVSASLFGEVEGRHFELNIADGKWHHLCYQWAWGQHTLYIDGIMSDEESYLSQEKNLPHRMHLVLGQPTSTTHGEPFKGLVSHVNIYSYTLKESLIKIMFNNCSMMVMGDVYSWPQTDAYVKGKVTIIAPRTCDASHCLPYSDDNLCDRIENKRDRIAPKVVQCPSDQVITNSSVLVQVSWQEPIFEDNVGIISIQQTHRSGQIFQHGEYMVTYVAWDAENNSVDCSFEVIVRPFACVKPPAPINGAKVCKTWLYGSFCSVTCLPSYMFVEQPPPFYSCGRLGFWDPPRGNPFRFPPCASIHNPSASLKGGIEFTGPTCSEEFKVQLKNNFFRAMWELDAGLGLCTAEVCDFENGFRVTCNPTTASRQRREIADVYYVDINLSITANSSVFQQASSKWVAEKVVTAIKQGRFDDSIFIAQHTSAHLTVDYQCLPGQVLKSITDFAAKACFDCPPGYKYDNVTKNCAICREGSYTEYPRQFHCILCPTGMTTSAPGSASIIDCIAVCLQGSYYNLSGGHCELCPKGQYQDTPGQTACSSCPTGYTTQRPGAASVELCRACSTGQELGGDGSCCPCPYGTYRESDKEDFCLSCPYGLTTDTTGSTSASNCTVVVCEKGWYRLETNTCAACPQGTFQPSRGTSQCIPCGVGLTTASIGSIQRDQCEPGSVNECVTGSHQCHKHAECMDTENSYNCTCKAGYTGDGINCTDLCLNYCGDHGVCDYGVKGEPYCNCATGYLGSQCNDKVVKDLSSAMIGGVAGFVVAVFVICIFTALCYWRHRAERKKTQSRIYRTRMSSSAFCNEGYETVHEGSNTPSQLIIQEQDSSSSSASSLSIAPRWNRSTFANSDEDETDACWFESLPMDDMSLGCDAFSRPALAENQSYF